MSSTLARVLLLFGLLGLPLWSQAQTLVGCWPMDNTPNDTSGNGFNGTPVGSPTYAAGQLGQALSLNGSTQYLTVAHNAAMNITGDITIAAWVKRTTVGDDDSVLAKTNATSQWDYEFWINGGGGSSVPVLYADSQSPSSVEGATGAHNTNWHHMAATRSGTTVTFYVDGASVAGGTMSGSFNTNTVGLRIGFAGGAFFGGLLDDVALYSGALSVGQIGTLMTAGCTPTDITTNLQGWWTLDNTLNDNSGNARHLTMSTGTPSYTTGQVNQSLLLSGTQRANTNLPLSTFFSATTGTLALWMRPTGTAPSDTVPYALHAGIADSSAYVGIHRGSVSGTDNIWLYNFSGAVTSVGTAYTVNTWVHVVWVHDSGVLSLYVNGAFVNSVASGNTDVMTGLLTIGGGGDETLTLFVGGVDEVRVYSRALPAGDVAALYAYASSGSAGGGALLSHQRHKLVR